MARFIILLGLVLVAIGLVWPWLSRLGLGRLPGDLTFGGEYGTVYIPITTSILISVVLSLALWALNR
jgi:Protein of unknown function (DUF2905)